MKFLGLALEQGGAGLEEAKAKTLLGSDIPVPVLDSCAGVGKVEDNPTDWILLEQVLKLLRLVESGSIQAMNHLYTQSFQFPNPIQTALSILEPQCFPVIQCAPDQFHARELLSERSGK